MGGGRETGNLFGVALAIILLKKSVLVFATVCETCCRSCSGSWKIGTFPQNLL